MEKELLALISGKCISDESAKSAVKAILDAGYRLDPYPNGKSKGELMAIIEAKDAELARARNMLRDTDHLLRRRCSPPHGAILSQAEESQIDTNRSFLAETSTVKS